MEPTREKSMASEEEMRRLFRIRKTVMQMLRDRNYLVLDSEISMSKSDFVDRYGNSMDRDNMTICKSKKNSDEKEEFVECFRSPSEAQCDGASIRN